MTTVARELRRYEVEKEVIGNVYVVAEGRVVKLYVARGVLHAIALFTIAYSPDHVWAARLGSKLEKYEWVPATSGTWVKAT